MHFSNLLVILAAAMVAAEDTTTMTSTMTQIYTITKCNPTYTACPLYTPTTSSSSSSSTSSTTTISSSSSSVIISTTKAYPHHNSTVSAGPTGYSNSSSTIIKPTLVTQTSLATVAPSAGPTTSAVVSTSGAGNLFVQSGLLMGAVGVAAMLL